MGRFIEEGVSVAMVVHGWSIEGKSKTACGLGWIYGRHQRGKASLEMTAAFTKAGITCKRCLKSRYLRVDDS